MRVQGQLEQACLEQVAASTTTPAGTGRIYIDTTVPSAAVPRIYNGSAWLQILTGQATSLVTNNSSLSVIVDWSKGVNQKIILTNHSVISFSNPQPGQIHTLVVAQKALENGITPYIFRFDMPDQDCRRGVYQPQGVLQSSCNQVFSWFYSASVKAAYATIPTSYANPNTLPSALTTGIDISPDGKVLAMGTNSSPFVSFYPVYDGGSTYFYGKKNYVTPTTAAAQVIGLCYTPDNQFIFYGSGSTPFIQGMFIDRGIGVTAVADPGTLPPGNVWGIAMHPGGSAVAAGHASSPFISVYPIVQAGFGSKYSNPVTLPAAQVNGVCFSPCGEWISVGSQTTPFLQTYPFDPVLGFGTIVSNPGTLPAGGPPQGLGKGVAWRPQGDYIAFAMSLSPFLYVVPFNRITGAYGTPLTITALSGQANCVAWSPDGQYLWVGNTTTPFLYCFDFSGLTIGTRIAFDTANPGQQVNDIVFHPNGDLIYAALNASPFVMTYPTPRKVRNYLKLNF